jgi:recombinational DNA repair protein RecR
MTDEEIAVEYEAQMAWDGEPLKTCPTCGESTHQKWCQTCVTEENEPIAITGNAAIDKVLALAENGKGNEIEDLETLLRAGFAPVQKGESA